MDKNVYNNIGFQTVNGRDDVAIIHISTSIDASSLTLTGKKTSGSSATVFAMVQHFPPHNSGAFATTVLRHIFTTTDDKGVSTTESNEDVVLNIDMSQSQYGIHDQNFGNVRDLIADSLNYPDHMPRIILYGDEYDGAGAADFALVYVSKFFGHVSTADTGNTQEIELFEDFERGLPVLVPKAILDQNFSGPRLDSRIGIPSNRLKIGKTVIDGNTHDVWVGYIEHDAQTASYMALSSPYNPANHSGSSNTSFTVKSSGLAREISDESENYASYTDGENTVIYGSFPNQLLRDNHSNATTNTLTLSEAIGIASQMNWINLGVTYYDILEYNAKHYLIFKDADSKVVFPETASILDAAGYRVTDAYHRISFLSGILPKSSMMWLLMDSGFRLIINPYVLQNLGYTWYNDGDFGVVEDISKFFPDNAFYNQQIEYLGTTTEGLGVFTLNPTNYEIPGPKLSAPGGGGGGGTEVIIT